jgi:uncharacterized membrane protein
MRILGHPLHPPLVHLPIAAWLLTPLSDAAAWGTADPFFARAALWLTGVGLAAALLAAAAGLIDLASARLGGRPLRLAGLHVGVMGSAMAVAGLGLPARLAATSLEPGWAQAAGVVAALLVLVGGWLGGELVHGCGVGRRR